MYSISGRLSRKFTGTRIRPQPLTPKNDVNSRAEFCEITATRPPDGHAERVELRGLRPRVRGDLPVGQRPEAGCRLVRLVDDPDPVGVDGLGAVQEVPDGQRVEHVSLLGRMSRPLWPLSPGTGSP